MNNGLPPVDDSDLPDPSEDETRDDGPSPRMPKGDDFGGEDDDDD